MLILFCHIFGEAGVHLTPEAIEVYGARKYLSLWRKYKETPLGKAARGVLEDEFKHEDDIVSLVASRKINPERIRNIFLGFNDGLVEILSAVSGFFAAFESNSSVLVASLTVAVAGSLSMSAGAFVAVGSEHEVERSELEKREFFGGESEPKDDHGPFGSAIIVGISYFIGALVPVLPVLLGAHTVWVSICAVALMAAIISYLLAVLSGMSPAGRVLTNLLIIGLVTSVTYSIGLAAKNLWGISI